ncbi:PIR protein, putative [Plasmodium sp. gorilla clade G1]|nr:PIR protein, putative [Plasmodium sp. gorilla clade G1]
MKLHYTKILLFYLLLNMLVISSPNAHNKNKSYITPQHTLTTTSRVLSEYDPYMPKYDNDEDMKSVKENFNRQTSQRFEEYEERMVTKRQKYKEQCEKDIQKIILKDKIEKSLEEKVEKGCLKCGCGLGGVAAGIGIFGALGTYGWKVAATAAAYETAKQAGIEAGVKVVIAKVKEFSFISTSSFVGELSKFINSLNYNTVDGLVEAVKTATASINKPCPSADGVRDQLCSALTQKETWFRRVVEAANDTTASITESSKTTKLGEVTTTSSNAYSAIAYSVTAILIIVLIMVIIYLILRYRRKKKMNKKLQYTKLINQ